MVDATMLGMNDDGRVWFEAEEIISTWPGLYSKCHNTAGHDVACGLPLPPMPRFICQTSVDYTLTLYSFSLSLRSTKTVTQHHNRECVLFKLFFGHEQHALRENSF